MTSMNESSYKPVIFTIATLVLLAIAISTVVSVSKSRKADTPKPSPTPEPTAAAIPSADVTSFKAYVTDVDVARGVITLCRLGDTDFEEYSYNGATDIRTAYNKPVTASTLAAGEFFTASVDSDGLLTSLIGLKTVDTYRNVRNMTIEPDLKRVTIGDKVYRYDDSLYLLNEGYFVLLDMLNEADVVDVYSIDNFICLIKIVSGHGYLALLNCDEFVGGTLTVDNSRAYQITSGMELTVSEGTHTFKVENGDLAGTGVIEIDRDITAYWSLAQYLPEPQEYGLVAFTVAPYGAVLYIDGIAHNYDTPISLTYGEHNVQVMLTGYTTYSGRIRIGQTSTAINISLSKIEIPDEDEDSDFIGDEDSDEDLEDEDLEDEDLDDEFDEDSEDYSEDEFDEDSDDDFDDDSDDEKNNADDDVYEGPVG